MKSHIWYASYGSNLLKDRFLCYIKGGKPEGASRDYPGCSDKTDPVEDEEIILCSELYFAKQSRNWEDAGVAFIKTKFEASQWTFGRMYLITEEQFTEVVKQEINFQGDLGIDFAKAVSEGNYIFREGSWYGCICYLGEVDGFPIFTFTNQNILTTTKPGVNYLKTLIRGIQERYDYLSEREIVDYLISKQGITDNYTKEDLTALVVSVNNHQ